jgi:periplasmic protein TonB
MGSDSSGARALYAPTPDIPDDMRDEPFQAVAVAHFTVSNNGDVRVSLTQPTANPRMNQILLDTLKQWRFFPAMKSGIAVDSEFDLRIPITVQ